MNTLEYYLTKLEVVKLLVGLFIIYFIYLAISRKKLQYFGAAMAFSILSSQFMDPANKSLNQKNLDLQEGKPVLLRAPTSSWLYSGSREIILQKENGKILEKTPGQILLEQQKKSQK